MKIQKALPQKRTMVLAAVMATLWMATSASAQTTHLPLSENDLKQVSEHVYVIMGWPNIGIVVGSRATLVVDTGFGARNGATIARVAQKLAKGPTLYLTTTHFHPEHATGLQGFPPNTIFIRAAVQQEEMDNDKGKMIEMFRSRPGNKELLEGLELRPPDITFENEMKLDLGGATARLFWLGPAHTKGDELIFVEEDRTLIPGDIVQNKLVPNLYSEYASTKNWLAILDKLEPLQPRFIVPDHGGLGDGSLIGQERAFLTELRARALELKGQGKPVEDAAQMLKAEFKAKYPDWTEDNVPLDVRRIYAEQ